MKEVIIILLFLLVLLSGCAQTEEIDLNKTACTEANNAGTCQTRLVEIGIIMPEECCEQFWECCE